MTAIDIKASDVQKLRQTTGAGLMDCKQALKDTNGDFDKAMRLLREKGIAKSSKRADRVAAEGLVEPWISEDGLDGILFELNSETDFVARNPEFAKLAKTYVELIQKNPSWTTIEQLPTENALDLAGIVGEKISARRFVRYTTKAGLVASYIHAGAKLGVLIQIDSNKPGKASENLVNLGRELTLQIAGANPSYVSSKDIPADIITREKDIAKAQMADQKKPAEILEKIATGKLQVFYEANCLLEQPHVRDASGKTKIGQLIEETGKKDGASYTVSRFVRFRVGAD